MSLFLTVLGYNVLCAEKDSDLDWIIKL